MHRVTFGYRPTAAGWSAVALGIGRDSVDLAVSNAGARLDDLLRAVLNIAGGGLRSEVSWAATDGDRFWWEMSRQAEVVHIEIARLWTHRLPEARIRGIAAQQGGLLLAADCSVASLSKAVFDGLMRTYFEIGARGYERLTSSAFPVAALDDLEQVFLRVTG